jgi:hypothetical protein
MGPGAEAGATMLARRAGFLRGSNHQPAGQITQKSVQPLLQKYSVFQNT